MLDRCRFIEWSLGLNHMLNTTTAAHWTGNTEGANFTLECPVQLLQMFTIEQRTIFIQI